MKIALTLAMLTVAVTMAQSAFAAQADKVIGRSHASGDFAITLASGRATSPHAILVKAVARPVQAVSVNWTLVCSKGTGAGSKSGGVTVKSGRLVATRFPMTAPDDCTVSAAGQLKSSGTITVTLLSR